MNLQYDDEEVKVPRGIPAAGFRNTKKSQERFAVARQSLEKLDEVVFETEEQIREKLETRFSVIRMMADAACLGQIRALIVSGAPGLGKSFTIQQALEEYDPEEKKTVVARGFTRATGLYKLLYQYRFPGNVLVLDDIDSAFHDPDSLNLLKVATDSNGKRRIHWGAELRITGDDGALLPSSFEFEGSIVIVTNFCFTSAVEQGNKLAPHFEALMSRAHYITTAMKSRKDFTVRIKMVVESGMLRDMDLAPGDEAEILDFIDEHTNDFRELTLRLVHKLANLYKANPANWKKIAKVTCFRNS